MDKIVFSREQIATFSDEEREMFDTLKEKANAVEVKDGFDVKDYLSKRAAKDAEDEAYKQQLEKDFV